MLNIYPAANGVSNYIGGIPTAVASNNTVTFVVTDSASQTLNLTLGLNVSVLGLSPGVLPTAQVGSQFSVSLTPSGGTPPYTIVGGNNTIAIPGLNLSPAGVISGSTLAAGLFPTTVQLTDSAKPANILTLTFDIVVDDQFDPGP